MKPARLLLVFLLAGLAVAVAAPGGLDLPMEPPRLGGPRYEEKSEDAPGEDPPDVPPPVIFGETLPGNPQSIAYVIDRSGSMLGRVGSEWLTLDGEITTGNRWECAKDSVLRSVQALDESIEFEVITFNCGESAAHRGELEPATEAWKKHAIGWLKNQRASGGTGTAGAMLTAFATGADVIVLVTDGAPDCGFGPGLHESWIRNENRKHVPVHVWGVGVTPETRMWCQRVAAASGGAYREFE